MKLSIITVVYNNEHTIESAINSVSSQTYKNIEYIVVDGNSTDNTNNIIKRNLNKITKYVSESDEGIYHAMNKGIKMATGDVIGILNSDDLYADEHVLSDVIMQFQNNPDLKLFYGDLVYVDSNDVNKVVRKWNSKPFAANFFEHANVPPHPSLFVKKDVYGCCGLFDIQYKLAADYDFMLRAFKQFGQASAYQPRLMVKMRLGGATNKSLKNILNGNKEILSSWKANGLKAPFFLMPLRIVKRLTQFI